MPGAAIGASADDVVITGLSGRLPESDSIEEFAEKLFAGVDLVTADDRRWTPGLYGLPERCGKLKDLAHFDAGFFGVHSKQANLMDPQLRIMLELTHEVIIDAGFNPVELRGSRTGVYVAHSGSESWDLWSADVEKVNGYAWTGCASSMFANRISYTYDLKGPSVTVDTACSSSMHAIVQATNAMRTGQCDSAIVAGTHLCLDPTNALKYQRLTMLSPEGRCASFDASGKGYARAEAIVVVLLQHRQQARRLYCTVRGARMNNDGHKTQGITYPSGDMQRRLAQETYEEAHLRPQDVVYVEAHGTGTKVGDPEEVNAIAKLFCKDRQTPLLVGSIKSNMGHSEPAAGLCSIAKVVLAMERGVIPGNLHFKKPFPNISALNDGRIKVVDKSTPWQGGLVGINSFGFGGSNAHIILESHQGARPAPAEYPIPRLVFASGRTDDAVERLLKLAIEHQRDAELLALIDAVHVQAIPGHSHRGYVVTDPVNDALPMLEVLPTQEPRPVWFVFSGMGSQWAGMARSLLRLPIFAASIARSATALLPYGVDLQHLISEASEATFDDIINSVVSIVAVQVALVDVLSEMGVHPDGFIGHSIGEVGCAYADGALTAEQAVLSAFWRGRCILDIKPEPGAMAAVGLSWEEAVRRCPADIDLACHNSTDNITISGPLASVKEFAEKLSADGVFVRIVKSSGLAFHSRYIAAAAPALRARLLQLIPEPKSRSTRWLSTSLPEDCFNSDLAKLSDADYHVNNLVAPVRFAAALAKVPADSLVLEVAPHALLQAILRRALPGALHVPLIHRSAADTLMHLLAAFGKMYAAGVQLEVAKLYPPVSWPVSRGTPMLASHVGWDHSVEWNVPVYNPSGTGEHVVEYDLGKPVDAFITGHNIDGRVLFPAAGYLTLVWRMVANMNKLKLEETALVIENVEFLRATIVPRDAPLRFLARLLAGTGEFEICEGSAVVVTGTARRIFDPSTERIPSTFLDGQVSEQEDLPPLNSEDIYKELRLRGYNYEGVFCGIKSSDSRGVCGLLSWEDNWISFMDAMLQFSIIGMDTQALYLPTRMQHVVIDPMAHLKAVVVAADRAVPIRRYRSIDVTVSGGIECRGVKTSLVPRRTIIEKLPKLEKYVFLPFDSAFGTEDINCAKIHALTAAIQLVVENCGTMRIKLTELALQQPVDALLLPRVLQVFESEPAVRVTATLLAGADSPKYAADLDLFGVKVLNSDAASGGLESGCHLVLCVNILAQHSNMLPTLLAATAINGFVLLEEPAHTLDESVTQALLAATGLTMISRVRLESCEYVLLRRQCPVSVSKVILEVRNDFTSIEQLKVVMKRAESEDMRVYLWSNDPDCGLMGLGKCLRWEPGGDRLRIYYLPGANDFDPEAPAYRETVKRDLAFNVLRDGIWGTYRHLPIDANDTTVQVEHANVNILTRGDLSSLRWIASDLQYTSTAPQRPGTDLCRVCYAPLNYRDVMIATGKLPLSAHPGNLAEQECILGLEFSGYSSTGKRVMGLVASKGLATTVLADENFMWEVPKQWSLEEAATVPVAYATAYYALVVRGRMHPGETVLVHSGTGGIGQAAITIALHAGCTVFTTVSTPNKRDFLRERFPQVSDENIGNSCDCSFEQLIIHRTHGRGVDLVLNSLPDDKLQASLRCLAVGGCFLEIGKLGFSNNAELRMAVLLKNTTVHGILLDVLFDVHADHPEKKAVVSCVTEGIAAGVVRPLPTTIFANNQLEHAFRYMETGKHIGRVVIRVCEELTEGASELARVMPAVTRVYMHPSKSYILVGGLGGFGLELSKWLVGRGARTLVLNSRSGVRTGYQAWCIRRWRERGVRVLVSTSDATTLAGARALLQEAQAAAPVAGVFNLAGVFHHGLLENLTLETFHDVTKPKINATHSLDVASREICPDLEHFVVFSSVASGRGDAGLSCYGLANSSMERLCEERRAQGLPGLAIQWGPIGDVGMFMNLDMAEACGSAPQSVASCLAVLDELLTGSYAVVSSMVLADKRRVQNKPTEGLVEAVANILGIKHLHKVSHSATLAELGMDSLMNTEIKQTLERSGAFLSAQETRTLTVEKLRGMSNADQ